MWELFSGRGSVCVSSLGVCHARTVRSLQHLSHARSLWGRSARPPSGKTTSVAICSHSETNSSGLMLINWNACRHMGYRFHFCPLALSPLTRAHTHPLAAHSPSECEPKWKWCIVVPALCKASLTHRDRNEQRHGHCSCKTLSERARVCVCACACVSDTACRLISYALRRSWRQAVCCCSDLCVSTRELSRGGKMTDRRQIPALQ